MSGGRASKAKGSAFERDVCVKLSLWISEGKNKDLFWRSAMSGGRATQGFKRGDILRRQAGDITAVAPEGHVLTDKFYIELKHLKNLAMMSFVVSNSGALQREWVKTIKQAHRFGRIPMMIVKQNNYATLVLVASNMYRPRADPLLSRRIPLAIVRGIHVHLFDELLEERFTTCL
jgi:hypothetical protein